MILLTGRWLILSAALLVGSISKVDAQNEPRRMNVLFIAVDDLNTRLACYGHSGLHTPHIDGLAARGIRFDRAYCQYPSCGPSRASLLTGRRPRLTGVLNNRTNFRERMPNAVTLPQQFRKQGYYVARVGKIFHQGVPIDIGTPGLDDPDSWDEVIDPSGRDREEEDLLTVYTPELLLQDRMSYLAADGTDREQTDGMVATEVIRLMKKHQDQPFFLAAGFYRPHIPYIAPKKYFELYDLEQTVLPVVPHGYRQTVPSAALTSTKTWPNFGTTARQARECILAYDASVAFVDAQVGRLISELDRLELSDKTIIVLWGDHGYHLGEHGLWRKNSLFEESARAPLIISAPGGSNHDCKRVVEFVDIYPTIMELAGMTAPPSCDGKSLVPLMRDRDAIWDDAAFTQVQFGKNDDAVPGRSIRTGRWRYVEWDEGRRGRELYNHQNDAREMRNVAENPNHAAIIRRLRSRMQGKF